MKVTHFTLSPVHLWRYRGGYPALTEVMNKLKQNKVQTHTHSLPLVMGGLCLQRQVS